MAITPVRQALPGITFARATEANIALANTATGGTEADLQDIISPVTLATGKITCTSASTAITGIGTAFTTDFKIGDYLFYYDLFDAEPSLLGKIETISSNNSMTLTSGAPTTINSPGRYCGKTNALLATQESIIMRVPVVRSSGTTFFLPNWNMWLSPNSYGAFNNSSTNNLVRYSAINNPTEEATPPIQNISYTITPQFGWQINPSTLTYFNTSAEIPNFAYGLIDPYGATAEVLAPNTLFKLFANPEFDENCIRATTSYSQSNLQSAGYFA